MTHFSMNADHHRPPRRVLVLLAPLVLLIPHPTAACEQCARQFERAVKAAITAKQNDDAIASLEALGELVKCIKTIPEYIWAKIAKDFGSEEAFFRALSDPADRRHKEALSKMQSLFRNAIHP